MHCPRCHGVMKDEGLSDTQRREGLRVSAWKCLICGLTPWIHCESEKQAHGPTGNHEIVAEDPTSRLD